MKKLALISLLISSSLAVAGGSRRHTPAPEPSPSPAFTILPMPSVTPEPLPSASPIGKLVTVRNITGATKDEVRMIRDAEFLVNDMVRTKCFEQWVLAARYSENQGLSQAQILRRIQSVPTTIDVEMYYANNSTVGFEYDPWDGVVHINRKFVYTAAKAADNLIHEDRGHSIGFRHDGRLSTSEPYGMNYAYEGCDHAKTVGAQEMLAKGGLAFRPPGIRIEHRKRGHAAPHRRVFPKDHKHRSTSRCREHGRWIAGCK